ncbi:GntR family transcriptional regulator [Prosthecomicrobium pneumaticum]|uniref:DNA-binding GntR family transcriptional regulator n=1 Tax=Prosthecomicrobium pneumaticum TaxID=81895 RepID=A0A7W9FN84_9HYPH|nr:GntR family transcriptional regulator [Prosthecomicrobium pneumaticum]MBB5753751.1 DNA-binding GntR family transcriptional regulator [Prosthecomicrobium pneumaticum]
MFALEPAAPPRTRSTAQHVYEMLRAEIVMNALKPREPIREALIAERLGVSRTPVREALLRLADLGLVDIYPQSATRVAPIRLEKVRAAQLIREAVEVEVVRRAAGAMDAAALAGLEGLIEDQTVAAERGDIRRLFELDEAFHRAIFAAAGLAAVADELEDVKVHLNRLRYVSVDWPRSAGFIVAEHAEIMAALKARDAAAAEAAMRVHLRAILAALDVITRRADDPAGQRTGRDDAGREDA